MPHKDPEARKAYQAKRRGTRGKYFAEYDAGRKHTPERMAQCRDASRDTWRKKNGVPQSTRPSPAHCEICGRPPNSRYRLALDHNHISGKFRGWLCFSCNTCLGKFEDNPVWLERAAEYVRRDGEEEWLCTY